MKIPAFLFTAVAMLPLSNAVAVEIVRVEEEWRLSVGEPTVNSNGPQVSMVMSPWDDIDGDFFMFYINLRTAPDYQPGGAQIQHMYGDQVVAARDNPNDSLLDQDSELLQWTQVLSIEPNGETQFEIVNGTSKSWGGFGGLGHLKMRAQTGQVNLNTYRPQISLNQSGIGYAGNRVVSLILMRISWFTSDGEEYTMHAPIDIDSDLDPWDD